MIELRRRYSGAEKTPPIQRNSEIWYVSTDGQKVTPYYSNFQDVELISNIYYEDYGVMVFSGDLTILHNDLFKYCTTLKEVHIPDSVVSFGARVFDGCTSLEYIHENNVINFTAVAIFRNCNNLQYFRFKENTQFINELGFEMFIDCTQIRIEGWEYIPSYGTKMFQNCNNLGDVVINNIGYIDGSHVYTFSYSYSNSIEFLDSVKNVQRYMFLLSTASCAIELPSSVEKIGEQAFNRAYNLQYVKIHKTDALVTCEANAFENCDWKIYVPNNLLSDYQTSDMFTASVKSRFIGY